MRRSTEMAGEISVLMPRIARKVLLGFMQTIEITQTQLFTIITLYDKVECSFSDLRNELHISAPTATGIIDRLEKSGYVKRVPDQKDRRVINIQLTHKGMKIAKELRMTIKSKWQVILNKLPASDADNYLKILKKIEGLLREGE